MGGTCSTASASSRSRATSKSSPAAPPTGSCPTCAFPPRTVEAQLGVAVGNYWKHFGQEPWGIWLGECGYYRGLDKHIKEAGLRYFFVDTHGILQGDPPSPKGNYAPIETPNGAFAFARDQESSKAVWSAEEGYPGDFRYREFYRDIGFDLDMKYIGPYIHPMGLRINTGIKYFRITGKGNYKEPYVEEWANQATREHAENFVFNRDKQADWLSTRLDTPACIVCPYDAELFGHWWYEGPMFLGNVMRKVLTEDNHRVTLSTPRDYLMTHKDSPKSDPAFSSWGAGGYADVWLNGSNDWIYPHLHKIADLMHEVAELPEGERSGPARPQPDGARTAAGPILGLGLHHENRDHGGLRRKAHQGPCAQLPGTLPPDPDVLHLRALPTEPRRNGQYLPRDRLQGIRLTGYVIRDPGPD